LSVQENKALVHEFFDSVWNKGDLAAADRLISPDALDHSPLGTEKGPESFKHVVSDYRAAFPDVRMTIEDEIAEGDRVVHRWRIVGTNKNSFMGVPPTGKEAVFIGTTVVKVRDGTIVERWTSFDLLGLLTQLGAIPPMGPPPAQH
jgi:steroid delta-isomerase-like uncharacterized protein